MIRLTTRALSFNPLPLKEEEETFRRVPALKMIPSFNPLPLKEEEETSGGPDSSDPLA
ncbi:hypothetical protein LEP1GSC126_0115 [Leptospira kirschneri str. 200801774]|uniref:hypothetical protein n=1 Tax=Leptospira kirschneri TaxID=29507 RepID=UPI0002BFB715|nr:hypothetical protein LEP1GSC126_0115 [Leptospira kirschneri str. 200801774]